MTKCVTSSYPLSGIENKHVLQEIDGCEKELELYSVPWKIEILPAGSAFLNLLLKGRRSRFGNDCTKRNVYKTLGKPPMHTQWEFLTFSLQIVWITSSGGVPNNSVIIEN